MEAGTNPLCTCLEIPLLAMRSWLVTAALDVTPSENREVREFFYVTRAGQRWICVCSLCVPRVCAAWACRLGVGGARRFVHGRVGEKKRAAQPRRTANRLVSATIGRGSFGFFYTKW